MHQPAIQHTRLPFQDRPDGSIEIMVITSCGTLRWVTPKGWPMKEEKSHCSAAREALKEARSVGKVGKAPIGTYRCESNSRTERWSPVRGRSSRCGEKSALGLAGEGPTQFAVVWPCGSH